ncbi:MAG: hypothetical protein VX672_04245, partial [Planctomycetota bacterium]|nr:hypothetical protein [Planctomycetota bacterium]
IGLLVIGGGAAATVSLMSPADANSADAKIDATQLHPVTRSGFDIVVPASGELVTERQLEIRNQLEGQAMITEIVAEGTFVRAGDVLLRLADDEILDRIKDAEDKLKTAESNVVAAEQTLAIRRSTMTSDLEKADLEIEIAQLAMKAWEEGDVLSKRQSNDLAIETAKINLDRLKNRFAEAQSLVDNGFISNDEYEQDRIRMIEAQAKVKEVELAKTVYERYTIKQDRAQRESAVEQSNAEKGRIEQRHLAEIVKIEADVESARFKLETARERLADLREQLDACLITAPGDGLVVYASSLSGERRGRGDEPPPQVGTELRQNELVMVLPDTSRMIASLKVGEALSGRVRPGQQAVVYSDSRPDDPVAGTVLGVSVLAESGGWRDPNRRDYTVKVGLDVDPEFGLKPSMRCRGEIMLGRVDDAINVPIQAVFRKGPLAFVYVPEVGGFAQRRVQVGRSSEMLVEIQDGLAVGDSVLLRRPSPGEVISELEMPEDPSGGGRFAGGRPSTSAKSPTADGRPSSSSSGGRPSTASKTASGSVPGSGKGEAS